MGAALWLFVFFLGCSGTYALSVTEQPVTPKCSLTGMWVNELGSKMIISPANKAGQFSGSYLTAVTATDNTIQQSPLQGAQHHTERRAQPTFGFTVKWTFSDSTTVFVGQCFLDENGQEHLKTTWLLREEMGSMAEDWKATRVGTNIFHRIK